MGKAKSCMWYLFTKSCIFGYKTAVYSLQLTPKQQILLQRKHLKKANLHIEKKSLFEIVCINNINLIVLLLLDYLFQNAF